MTALEANVRRLKEGQDMAVKQIEEQGTKQEQALTVERTAREHAIQEALTRMEKFGIGGFQVELIGVIWLTVGVILATIPGEISAGLQAVFKQ